MWSESVGCADFLSLFIDPHSSEMKVVSDARQPPLRSTGSSYARRIEICRRGVGARCRGARALAGGQVEAGAVGEEIRSDEFRDRLPALDPPRPLGFPVGQIARGRVG